MTEALVVTYLLVLVRVASCVAAVPMFAARAMPRLVKVGLAVGLSVLWIGAVDVRTAMSAWIGDWNWLALALSAVREMLIGGLLGYAFGLFVTPARVAGEFIGQEMGLSLGATVDPALDGASTVVGQLFEVLAMVMLFALDVHHVLFGALHATFARWPIGGANPSLPVGRLLHGMSVAHEWGLSLAAPVAGCLFLTTVVLALLSRAAPQFSLFTVGFPLRLVVGLGAAMVFLPSMARVLTRVYGHFSEFVWSLW